MKTRTLQEAWDRLANSNLGESNIQRLIFYRAALDVVSKYTTIERLKALQVYFGALGINAKFKHDELAELVAASREKVCLALKKMKQENRSLERLV